ncbi:hypothetical protein B0J11DRAFT_573287 [Dendryphion nanum]|uniref:Uncharacterized protein n=1 Tax=Dendryphion nanum TaxID=256645 RepID=A0A9P9I950_9PLEO|nr:hypothetical protein B0J11DRAFT_573287 [Dendryphion nanum]
MARKNSNRRRSHSRSGSSLVPQAKSSHTIRCCGTYLYLVAAVSLQILDIRLFVQGNFLSRETRRGNYQQIGERIDMTYDALGGENVGVEELIKAEMKDRKGLTVVSLCTNGETGDKIREVVRVMLDETIYLKELDFRPTSDEEFRMLRSWLRGPSIQGKCQVPKQDPLRPTEVEYPSLHNRFEDLPPRSSLRGKERGPSDLHVLFH